MYKVKTKLSRSERLDLYRKALVEFDGEFLCVTMFLLFKEYFTEVWQYYTTTDTPFITTKIFPELLRHKPAVAYVHHAWFGSHLMGWNKRVEVLTKIIRRMERRERILKFFGL